MQTEPKKARTIPAKAQQTRIFERWLAELIEEGREWFTWEEAIAKVGATSKKEIRHWLAAARKTCNIEHGRWWASVPGSGYRLLPLGETPSIAAEQNRRARRGLQRGIRRVLNVMDRHQLDAKSANRAIIQISMSTAAAEAMGTSSERILMARTRAEKETAHAVLEAAKTFRGAYTASSDATDSEPMKGSAQ